MHILDLFFGGVCSLLSNILSKAGRDVVWGLNLHLYLMLLGFIHLKYMCKSFMLVMQAMCEWLISFCLFGNKQLTAFVRMAARSASSHHGSSLVFFGYYIGKCVRRTYVTHLKRVCCEKLLIHLTFVF